MAQAMAIDQREAVYLYLLLHGTDLRWHYGEIAPFETVGRGEHDKSVERQPSMPRGHHRRLRRVSSSVLGEALLHPLPLSPLHLSCLLGLPAWGGLKCQPE